MRYISSVLQSDAQRKLFGYAKRGWAECCRDITVVFWRIDQPGASASLQCAIYVWTLVDSWMSRLDFRVMLPLESATRCPDCGFQEDSVMLII